MHWSSSQVWLKPPSTPQSLPSRHSCGKVGNEVRGHWSSTLAWLKSPNSAKTQKCAFIPKKGKPKDNFRLFYLKLNVEFKCLI